MTASQTARERARAELTREIKEEARRQVAATGAQRLSLRAVARELGMVSSALYRYFPSRDDLLTALIIDAYDALGESAERATAALPRADVRGRWRACCTAVRGWALAHPHEYALIYGSPVPGYHAPQETITSASRVALVLGALLAEASALRPATGRPGAGAAASPRPVPGGPASQQPAPAGLAHPPPAPGRSQEAGPAADGEPGSASALPQQLRQQAAVVGAAIAPGVGETAIVRALIAWTQLFGMISFELFGQLVGSADPADDFFGYAVDQMADFVGLP
jgi:AcrR family transcriptional regulator